MSDVEDLTAWLLAQIDADERDAKRCPGTDFSIGEDSSRPGRYDLEAYAPGSSDRFDTVADKVPEVYARHIEAWDPARVEAECEAKRQIVDIHSGPHSCGFSDYDDADPCPTLKALALPYAHRTGYREEWRP